MISQIQDIVQQAIQQAFLGIQHIAEVTQTSDVRFGDYQCNSAMKLAKELRLPPKEVAESIVIELTKHTIFSSVQIAGPGFINMYIAHDIWAQRLMEIENGHNAIQPAGMRQKIIVDFSSPNVAKEMHVGHLRSTIIGDCIANVFEALGHDVLRLNHIGDWGTSFGMLIAHIKSVSININTASLADLQRLYKESKVRFDDDPVFHKEALHEVVRLQGGDAAVLQLWRVISEISRQAYQQIYDMLDVRLVERGESFYNQFLPSIVSLLEQQGLITMSDGAKCLFCDGFYTKEGTALPLMIQKSDGGYTYDTTDMAALYHRVHEERADRIVYVTDCGQSTHFAMVFWAARAARIVPTTVRLDHVPFGLVLGPDRKEFRTRSGETERLIDLLTTAVEKATVLVQDKEMTELEKQKIAHVLAMGAVKYADLSSNRVHDYTFSYERMLKFEGNTASFIMYAYVRAKSILRREKREEAVRISLEHPTEVRLGALICQFSDVVHDVAQTLLPNRLTEYLYALAEQFNLFFRDCRVSGHERCQIRLALVAITAKILEQGLHLLSIEVPEKM